MASVSFDKHQFAGYRSSLGKLAATGNLDGRDFGESGFMHFANPGVGRPIDYIPPFSSNAAQLRQVLLTIGFNRTYSRRGMCCHLGLELPKKEELNHVLLTRLTLEINTHMKLLSEEQPNSFYWNRMADSLRVIENVGGYVALCGALAYRAWTLRWTNEEIGSELDLKAVQVRNILNQIRLVARSLGFDTKCHRGRRHPSRAVPETVLAMWHEGKGIYKIARELKCGHQQVKVILSKHGIVWSVGQKPRIRPPKIYVKRPYNLQSGRTTQEGITTWWGMGYNQKEIIAETGCSRKFFRESMKGIVRFCRRGGDDVSRYGEVNCYERDAKAYRKAYMKDYWRKRNERPDTESASGRGPGRPKKVTEGILGLHEPAPKGNDGREASLVAGSPGN